MKEDELNSLMEIKATRNLLLHNNLKENSFYQDAAGPNKRQSQGIERRLIIDQDYLFQSLVNMRTILRNFETELLDKYSGYTKIRAIRQLFNYIFKTPLMDFENEFEVDKERDTISAKLLKENKRKRKIGKKFCILVNKDKSIDTVTMLYKN